MRPEKSNKDSIVPEVFWIIKVYMVNDQAQALERDGVFEFSESRKMLKIREKKDKDDIVP